MFNPIEFLKRLWWERRDKLGSSSKRTRRGERGKEHSGSFRPAGSKLGRTMGRKEINSFWNRIKHWNASAGSIGVNTVYLKRKG